MPSSPCLGNDSRSGWPTSSADAGGKIRGTELGALDFVEKPFRVADLAHTRKCRLARIVRKELRKRNIHGGVKVVYSLEEFRPLADGRREGGTDENYQARRAPLGSSSVVPPIFGLTMAGEVIRTLLEEN